MKSRKSTLSLFGLIILLSLTSCKTSSSEAEGPVARDRQELSRESISPLIKTQLTKTLEGVFASGGFADVIGSLVDEKVLTCNYDSAVSSYWACKPGPNAQNIRMDNGYMIVSVGQKIPTVTGVSKIDSTSGVAQVDLTFQPSEGYEHFRHSLNGFRNCTSRSAQKTERTVSACDTQNEKVTVHLRLYDDGWRVEKVD